ncbi:hypothetical protein CVT25_004579 [Psilocybe cyanescens]|uniref:F-box domain-containing protein n=1 Tax=Psilocybe cyanescens TaxID=93625 RepID=A0A409X2D6_PSICY|nr:hypothetical protein CVT25_004579 [Psilocybe cyanescens]
MSTTGLFPFNDLPVELQREIFLVAATVDPSSARQLVLVAKRVNSWVQPCIYEMVALGSVDTALFLRTMDAMPPSFFAAYVKKLCLSVSVGASDAAHIIRVCTGLIDLAFWVDHLAIFPDRSIAPMLCSLPLKRLSIEYKHFLSLFWEPQVQLRWYNTLTHLDIIFWRPQTAQDIPHLEKFPHLTHLSLRLRHDSPSETTLTAMLSAYRHIKLLVILGDTEPEASDAQEVVWPTNPRVVYIPYPSNVVKEWESQARDDPDCVWSRAEELVRTHTAEFERSSATS